MNEKLQVKYLGGYPFSDMKWIRLRHVDDLFVTTFKPFFMCKVNWFGVELRESTNVPQYLIRDKGDKKCQ